MSKVNVVKMVGDLRVFFVAWSSCLFQISRRIRVIKLHMKKCSLLHYS